MTATRSGVQKIRITAEDAGQRIDNYLMRILKGVPRSRIYRIVRRGEVRVNGGRVRPTTRLKADDEVRVPPVSVNDAPEGVPKKINITTLYEDDLILIVNKPPGLAVHGGSGISHGVIESLRHQRDEPGLELVHRLDRDTSGCLMIARRRSYLRQLQDALRQRRQIGKRYLAIVHGQWPQSRNMIDAPLHKNVLQSGERVSRVSSQGREAITEAQLIASHDELSLLSLQPVTGRTHQLRVHCEYVGQPILGDDKYGLRERDRQLKVPRLMLHAAALDIPPLGDQPAITVTAAPDSRMSSLMEHIKNN